MIDEEKQISVLQAYKVMLAFLDKEYELSRSDDLAGLLSGYQLTSDESRTMDPAAWHDWIAAVNKIFNVDAR